MEPAKVIIEVTGGLIPGEPMKELTRRWVLTHDQATDRTELNDAAGAAMLYALVLANPAVTNWVRHEWIWL